MPRTTLPSEDCVFRLDSRNRYRSEFPVTFNNVGLTSDGYEFDGAYQKILTPLSTLDLPDEFTMVSFDTITSVSTNPQCIWASEGVGDDSFYLQAYYDSANIYKVGLFSWNPSIEADFRGTHCTMLTYSDGVGVLYVDGEILASGSGIVRTNVSTLIGIRELVTPLSTCYDFRIYDKVLTPTQAKKIAFDMVRKIGRN